MNFTYQYNPTISTSYLQVSLTSLPRRTNLGMRTSTWFRAQPSIHKNKTEIQKDKGQLILLIFSYFISYFTNVRIIIKIQDMVRQGMEDEAQDTERGREGKRSF